MGLTGLFWGGLWKDFGTLGEKTIECSKTGRLFCGDLKDY